MGRLSLVDNTVDVSTGMVRLKATYQNDDRRLYPGQFVNVVLTLGTENQAIVVPSQAVQAGQDKSIVYVVKADSTLEVRTVKTGSTIDNMTVINDGLKPGEQVVTDGQLRLVPGAKVQQKAQAEVKAETRARVRVRAIKAVEENAAVVGIQINEV